MWSSLVIAAVLVGVIPSPPRVDPSLSEIAAGLTAAGTEVLPPPEVIEHVAMLASVALETGVLEQIETRDADGRVGDGVLVR